jgi:hypothetical protein
VPGLSTGQQRRNRLGVADSSGSQKGESEPTPGYSVFTKKTLQVITAKYLQSSLVLIKDYAEEKSKADRQTGAKAGQIRPTVSMTAKIYEKIHCKTID